MKQCSDPFCPYVTPDDEKRFCPIDRSELEASNFAGNDDASFPCLCGKTLKGFEVWCSYCGEMVDLARAAHSAREVN